MKWLNDNNNDSNFDCSLFSVMHNIFNGIEERQTNMIESIKYDTEKKIMIIFGEMNVNNVEGQL